MVPRIHRFDPATRAHLTIDLPFAAPLGMISQTEDPNLLVLAQPSGVFLFDIASKRLTPFAHPEASRSEIAYNDGKVDRQGRLWLGSRDSQEHEPRGALWMISADRAPDLIESGLAVVNGPAFSPDGRTAYISDSLAGIILVADVGDNIPWLTNRRVFAKMGPEEGLPDGLTVDREGCVWCAHWDGGRVTRFSPRGERVAVIGVQARRVTSVAFGGEHLSTLYITTARYGLSDAEAAASPAAGDLFAAEPGVQGIAETPLRLPLCATG